MKQNLANLSKFVEQTWQYLLKMNPFNQLCIQRGIEIDNNKTQAITINEVWTTEIEQSN